MLSPLQTSHSSYSPTQSSILSHTKSPSASSHGRSTHSPVSKLRAWPSELDTTNPDKHASKSVTTTSRLVSNPEPAGTTLPSNENPKSNSEPTDTSNPASPAAPPEAPSTSTPEIANWKPAISSEEE